MNAWSVRLNRWAPRSRLTAPLSATAYESLLACPLQLLYLRDTSFPRCSGPFARIGTAFHRALESLPSVLTAKELEVAIRMLLGVFRRELETQRAAASANPREVRIPWPDDRVHHAEQALAFLVHRSRGAKVEVPSAEKEATSAEAEITTRDGFLTGVIDRVDQTREGVVIVDYKSAESYDDKHLERFRRQLLLYAYLWFDRHARWPAYGVVNFLLLGKEIPVELVPRESERLVAEIRTAFNAAAGVRPSEAARPGDACSRCDYRPWCEPFWGYVARVDGRQLAVEGTVAVRSPTSPRVLSLSHGGYTSQLVLDDARLGLAQELAVGTRIRVLDPVIDGVPPVGRYRLTDRSEVWCVS